MDRRIPWRCCTIAALLAGFWVSSSSPAAHGASASRVNLSAWLDRRPVQTGIEGRPIRLDPSKTALVRVRVANRSSRPITVKAVRLEGRVMGLAFFAYDTSVGMRLAPNSSQERTFELDLVGLRGQATGLIPSAVKILDQDRTPIDAVGFTADIRGSLRSVYGGFGLTIAALTIVSFLDALMRLARHLLSQNRWRRALRFATPGVGVGLVIIFTLSALRVLAPTAGRWVPILTGSTLIFFAMGYLTPTPGAKEDEEDDLEQDTEAASDAPAANEHADTTADEARPTIEKQPESRRRASTTRAGEPRRP